jgi:hypothetical protein
MLSITVCERGHWESEVAVVFVLSALVISVRIKNNVWPI